MIEYKIRFLHVPMLDRLRYVGQLKETLNRHDAFCATHIY